MLAFQPEEYKVLYNVTSTLAEYAEGESFEKLAYVITVEAGINGCSIWRKKQDFEGITRLGYFQTNQDNSLPDIDHHVAEQVINNGRPWSKNWFEDAHHTKGEVGINGMALPLLRKDETIGVLCLWMSKDHNGEISRNLAKELAIHVTKGVELALKENEHEKIQEEQAAKAEHFNVPILNMDINIPKLPGIDIAARSASVRVGRTDFYDFLANESGGSSFIMGDTMSVGAASEILQFTTRMVYHAIDRDAVGPGKILSRINDVLYPELKKQGIFLGCICGVFDPENKVFNFANAGYNDPVIITGSGETVTIPKVSGGFLGEGENATYKNTSTQLKPGDVVVFYSDGLIQGMNENGQFYTVERLLEDIQKNRLLNATALLDCLFLDIRNYIGIKKQFEDITLIVIKVT